MSESNTLFALTLGGSGISHYDDKKKAVDGCLPIQTDAKVLLTYEKVDFLMSLYGVSFSRKMYEPGHIQAELLLQTTSACTVEFLSTMLVGRGVSLSVNGEDLASNYYIQEISPLIETDKGSPYVYTYVKLEIFSKDNILKYTRFSKAHLGEKFFTDIVAGFLSTASVSMRPLKESSLQKLMYTVKVLNPETKKQEDAQEELIQPYLVQYNESFYDFMRRVANRCGETFYFEDGKFCVGLSSTASAKPLPGVRSVSFHGISQGPLTSTGLPGTDYTRETVKEIITIKVDENGNELKPSDSVYADGTDKKVYRLSGDTIITDDIPTTDGFPTDAFPSDAPLAYNAEVSNEDQYMVLYQDRFANDASWQLWLGDVESRVVGWISQVLNATTLLDLITKFGQKELEAAFKLAGKVKESNKKGNQTLKNEALDESNTYAVLFAKVDDVLTHWLTLDYYHDVRSKEEEQARKMVCIDMGEGFSKAKLGDLITIPDYSNQTYVVVQIDITSGTAWKRNYDSFTSVAPVAGGLQSQRIYAIPVSGGIFYPPLLPDSPFRKCGPQPAFVIDADDPTQQGRVRVRYPWQPSTSTTADALKNAKKEMDDALKELKKYATVEEKEDGTLSIEKDSSASEADFNSYNATYATKKTAWLLAKFNHTVAESATPWIRMVTPMATSGGGMFFKPEVGDEVMVDYEGGNIDRPYVTGTLYSKNVHAPQEGDRVIVSKNGHSIRMSDPSNAAPIFAGVFPFLKFLTNYGVKIPSLDDKGQSALGGIELTDRTGLYDIKMSSHDRSISISSPLGTVSIDALTGISIEAPNGDISISGKNVEIEAFNKLTLTSGKNVAKDHKNKYLADFRDAKSVGKSLGKTVASMSYGKFVDLSFLRALLEIIIRPVDGTLQIKSNRFVLIEAGNGEAAGEASYYDAPTDKPGTGSRKKQQSLALYNLINEMKNVLTGFIQEYVEAFNEVKDAIDAFPAADFGTNAPGMISRPADNDQLLQEVFDICPTNDNGIINALNSYTDASQNNQHTHLNYTANTTPDQLDSFYKRTMNLMSAVTALKRKSSQYEHLYDDLKKLNKKALFKNTSVDAGGTFTILKSLISNVDAQTILKLTDPIVDDPVGGPAPAPLRAAGVQLQDPTPKQDGTNNRGLYKQYILITNDFTHQNGGVALFGSHLQEASFDNWRKAVLRRLACLVIQNCRANDRFKDFKILPAEYENIRTISSLGISSETGSLPANEKLPFNDPDWSRYVAEIKLEAKAADSLSGSESVDNFIEGFSSASMDALLKFVPMEFQVWKSDAQGEILFSDKKNETYHFRSGSAERYQNADRLMDEYGFRNLLMSL